MREKGFHHSKETIEKIRKSNQGKHFFKHTEKALDKIGEASKKLWKQKWYRDKMLEVVKRPNSGRFKKGIVPWNDRLKGFLAEEKHWNWKGGITPLNLKIRKSAEYRRWRKAVLKRDNSTCIKCKIKEKVMIVDHIKSFKLFPNLRFILDNGRTLCKKCDKIYGWNHSKELALKKKRANSVESCDANAELNGGNA